MKPFVLAALIVLVGTPALAGGAEQWITGLDYKRPGSETWQRVVAPRVRFVATAHDAAVLALLDGRPIVALNARMLARIFPDGDYTHDPALKPYLVRAVEHEALGGGDISVSQYGSEIAMDFYGLENPGALRRRAAVLFLPTAPEALSVTVSLYP